MRVGPFSRVVVMVLLWCMTIITTSSCGPDLASSDNKVRLAAVRRLTDQSLLAKVAQGDGECSVRLAAVERLSDQVVLMKIIKGDDFCTVRNAAVQRLTDQSLIEQVILDSREPDIRKLAIGQLKNQEVLSRLISTSKEDDFRQLCVSMMTNQVQLVALAISNDCALVRESAEMKLKCNPWSEYGVWVDAKRTVRVKDQSLLHRIAIEAKNLAVRLSAVTNLTDQMFLKNIVLSEREFDLSCAAVQRITNQTALCDIVMQSGKTRSVIAYRAIENLTDKDSLSLICASNFSGYLRDSASRKLFRVSNYDEPAPLNLLGRIVTDAVPKEHRAHAFEVWLPIFVFLSQCDVKNALGGIDSATLTWERVEKSYGEYNIRAKSVYGEKMRCTIKTGNVAAPYIMFCETDFPNAVNDDVVFVYSSGDVRKQVCSYLTQSMVAKIAAEDDNDWKKAAVENLVDQELIAKIGLEDVASAVRVVAVSRLTDQRLLEKLADESSDFNVYTVAVGSLTNQETLAKYALDSKKGGLRCAAVGKLSSQSLLIKIALQDVDPWVRERANARLVELENARSGM